MPETMAKYSELESVSTDQETESNWGPAVAFQIYFQEAKADEDHNINILEDWIVHLDLGHGCRLVGCLIGDLQLTDKRIWLDTDFVLSHESVENYQDSLAEYVDDLEELVRILHSLWS